MLIGHMESNICVSSFQFDCIFDDDICEYNVVSLVVYSFVFKLEIPDDDVVIWLLLTAAVVVRSEYEYSFNEFVDW